MKGYVRADGDRLVDDEGPLLMRGIGLGNWLVPEGYMWGLPGPASSPRQIEALTVALLGWDGAEAFWRTWRSRYVADTDLALIRDAGFDHVRLPLNWRLLCSADGEPLAEGFRQLDAFVASCRRHGLRVVLDLHAAPGGQTGTNIDDSAGLPELFLDRHWQRVTLRLWTLLAARFASDPTVLAYDLLNEPLPYHWADQFTPDLVALYRGITAAVREVDLDHLIMYEGTRWATDFSGFTEMLDANSAFQFHKYWSRPDEDSLAPVLSVAHRLGSPLYMGEGGENTNDWNASATALYERLGISWCAWPYKAIGRPTAVCTVPVPDGWDAVAEFAAHPSAGTAGRRAATALEEFGAALDTRGEWLNQGLVHALMRRAPTRLPASAYTFRSAGVELLWPERFELNREHDVALPLGVEAELAPGASLEFAVRGSSGRPVVVPSGDGLDITTVTHGGDAQSLRVVARAHARFTAIEVPAPEV